jgi:hypothetical protein
MPKQNRVTPFGDLIAVPERGTFMGNRGILHDERGRIRRAWQVKRWLVCVLQFRGRKRTVMTPNRYTELFFLDEATALAAGHRPCAECRHARYIAFRDAWVKGRGDGHHVPKPSADEMDNLLHAERIGPNRSKAFFMTALDRLPDGVLVTRPDTPDQVWLVLGDHLWQWSWAGYCERTTRPKIIEVKVLTPRSTVAAIKTGYTPEIHASATQSRA